MTRKHACMIVYKRAIERNRAKFSFRSFLKTQKSFLNHIVHKCMIIRSEKQSTV